MAILSILTLYNYDSTIFDNLVIPTGADIVQDGSKVPNPWIPDRQALIDYICFKAAELEVVYADPDVLKEMIGVWSKVRNRSWIQLYNTLLYSYNPIWNKDGVITENRQQNTGNAGSNSGTLEHQVTGYDSTSYSPSTKDISSGSYSDTGNLTEGITRKEQGNIGITSTQELIQKERELAEFNLYEQICREFRNEFCLLLY